MLTLGFMTLTMDSESGYLTEIAKRAAAQQVECVRFIPSSILPNTHLVKGKKFDASSECWVEDEFPLPALIYDRCFYGNDEHSKQCLPIVSWLKNRDDIQFLGYGLPNKLELYEVLHHTELGPYLPASKPVSQAQDVFSELKKQQRVILKPINGAQGYGIYYLKKNEKTFHVKTEKQKKIISRIFPNEEKLLSWLNPLLHQLPYLIQPYLELTNDELQPFDIRLLLQKDADGSWTERGRGIRTGLTGGILSNLSAGGMVSDFVSWSEALPPAKKAYICSELDYIKSHLTRLVENEFLPLFELGVDIGVAKNGSLWILDVNSKPGRKVILSTNPAIQETLYNAPVHYAKLLTEIGRKERKSYYAKTLSH
ncbi:YheC/YheD family protein [Neobacillus sp. SM06]|uniref:YheC/YheD family endospore coat-associated protein n=1 Tax=Neobacillus sp. SM06 TaxID=3422492 RepID=UPI003D26CAAA